MINLMNGNKPAPTKIINPFINLNNETKNKNGNNLIY